MVSAIYCQGARKRPIVNGKLGETLKYTTIYIVHIVSYTAALCTALFSTYAAVFTMTNPVPTRPYKYK